MTVTRTTAVTHFAGRAGDHNDRAMRASGLLAADLATRTGQKPIVVGSPQPALNAKWDAELSAARQDLRAMAEHFDALMRSGAFPITALSRCAVALATLPAVARHRPDAVVVWFDAHADLNTPQSSGTGYLGGLALSGPLGMWDSGFGAGLTPENTILCGTRDIDPPEQRLIDEGVITLVGPGPDLAARLRSAIAGRPVYVHIDCDVLEPGIVPTDYRVPGGLGLDDLHDAALAMSASEIVGIEIGELEDAPGVRTAPVVDTLLPVLISGRA
ncbi:arginase family protein [Actinoplanes sp. NPDC051851]|uniref:arginase family protein n=1 Tax=Actinoplanes sp. NPDC051851 TaxID=3154753 RepID=UPI003418E5B9